MNLQPQQIYQNSYLILDHTHKSQQQQIYKALDLVNDQLVCLKICKSESHSANKQHYDSINGSSHSQQETNPMLQVPVQCHKSIAQITEIFNDSQIDCDVIVTKYYQRSLLAYICSSNSSAFVSSQKQTHCKSDFIYSSFEQLLDLLVFLEEQNVNTMDTVFLDNVLLSKDGKIKVYFSSKSILNHALIKNKISPIKNSPVELGAGLRELTMERSQRVRLMICMILIQLVLKIDRILVPSSIMAKCSSDKPNTTNAKTGEESQLKLFLQNFWQSKSRAAILNQGDGLDKIVQCIGSLLQDEEGNFTKGMTSLESLLLIRQKMGFKASNFQSSNVSKQQIGALNSCAEDDVENIKTATSMHLSSQNYSSFSSSSPLTNKIIPSQLQLYQSQQIQQQLMAQLAMYQIMHKLHAISPFQIDPSAFICLPLQSSLLIDDNQLQIHSDRLIGEGGFGQIYHGTFQNSQVAVKILEGILEEEDIKAVLVEIQTMLQLKYHAKKECFVELFGVCLQNKPKLSIQIVMERMAVDLKQYLKQVHETLTLLQRVSLLVQILNALTELHACNFVHCDLKPANILLDVTKQKIKLCDFGLSRKLHWNNRTRQSQSVQGFSERYSSYEYLSENKMSPATDVWSFGILMYEVITARNAWGDLSGVQILAQIMNKTPFFACKLNQSTQVHQIDDIIKRCLNYEYRERPTAAALFEELQCLQKQCVGSGNSGVASII